MPHPPLTAAILHDLASQAAFALPATEIRRFSSRSDAEAAYVAGKWFMVLVAKSGQPLVNLKAHPADVAAIIESHPAARPAWHMNKTHWYSLAPHPDLTGELLAELIAESYLTVVETLPKARRPTGWQTALPSTAKSTQQGSPVEPQ